MLNTELKEKNTTKVVHVSVAVIQQVDEDSNYRRILIAKRPDHAHQGGLWEFPGGKVEANESVIDALDRELFEELDIRIKPLSLSLTNQKEVRPLIQIKHAYSDKTVFLDVWLISSFHGEPKGKEGQEVRWVDCNKLYEYDFPVANKPIVSACLLPNRYFITPEYASKLDAESGLKLALSAGAELIYFRQPQLDHNIYYDWLKTLLERMPVLSTKLMHQSINSLNDQSGAGVHLSFKKSYELKSRPVCLDKWFAVSCHNAEEIAHAKTIGADFITLSPVLKTKTHPEHRELGWDQFKNLVLQSTLPVFGLGGLSFEQESEVITSGGQGIAGIGFWQNNVE